MKNLLSTLLAIAALSTMIACGGNKADTVEANDATEVAPTNDANAESYTVNSGTVYWTGSKSFVDWKHNGTIQVTGGNLSVSNGLITAGSIDIDLNTINDLDMEASPDKKAKLEGHLKSPDFFDVATYPKATFTVVRSEQVEGNPDITHNITGNLTMRGMTKEITIPASVAVTDSGLSAVTPNFTINRMDWNVKYDNASIEGIAKDAIISNDLQLSIQLSAAKS